MTRGVVVVAALASLLVGCGGDDDDVAWARAACEPAKPQPAGTHELTVVDRTALVHVPAAYDGTEAYPLVFGWHSFGSNAADHLAYADFRSLAESEHFLIVVPQGAGDPPRFNLGAGITGDTDDVAFAGSIIDQVAADYCLDATRVYSSGVSNGGGMSALLACRAPDRFAAIGMNALSLFPEPCAGAVAVLGMQGDADLVVPIQGGELTCCDPGWTIPSAGETMQRWAEHDGCTDSDDAQVEDHVERITFTGCADGTEVQYWVIRGGGHTWPGADDASRLGTTNQEIDASQVMWEFFRRFTTAR